jgi:dihydroflavonol-4-reductase
MKVLIAGAGGYLGEHVAHAAVEAGHDVALCLRGAHGPQFPDRVQRIEGDLNDVAFVRHALHGVDAAIFCAGRNWQPGLADDEYVRQNVSIVETFFAALAQSNPGARVVFTSSMSAVAGSEQPIVFTEDGGRDAVSTSRLSPYDRAKVECERIARKAAAEGRQLVILNPGYMLGPGASPSSNVTTSFQVRWFCLGKTPAIVRRGGHTYCDVRDVARAHVAALTQGAAGSQYIVGGENLGAVDFHRLMSQQTGLRVPMRVSARDAAAVMGALDALSAATFGLWTNPVHRSFARSLPLYYWGGSSPAARDLGYRSRPTVATIRDTITDFVVRGLLPGTFRFVAGMNDKNRDALLLLREIAQGHLHRAHLLPRLSDILAACRQNHQLNATLEAALTAGRFDPDRGRFRWEGAPPKGALKTLRNLLDYCYYASDEFRERVT